MKHPPLSSPPTKKKEIKIGRFIKRGSILYRLCLSLFLFSNKVRRTNFITPSVSLPAPLRTVRTPQRRRCCTPEKLKCRKEKVLNLLWRDPPTFVQPTTSFPTSSTVIYLVCFSCSLFGITDMTN